MDIESHIQCDPNPCFNNGKCEAFTNDLGEAGYRCICSVGVTGRDLYIAIKITPWHWLSF